MSRKRSDSIRLTLDVSPELNSLLEDLAAEQHTSKADVLRKGVAFLKFAKDEKDRGRRVGSVTPGQDLATELVGF